MAFWKGNENELPEKLRNMKPEDLIAAVEKSAQVDSLRTELDATKGRLSEVDELRTKLATLEANSRPASVPARDEGPRRPTSVLDDEDRAFNERMAPLAISIYQNQAQTAKHLAMQGLSPRDKWIWNKYENEVDSIMESVNLQFKAMPETWVNALNTVAGRHLGDIMKAQEDKSDFFAESAASITGPAPRRESTDEFNADDERMAKRFGLTKEAYLASRKEMVVR
jgi:hypothetical protein